MGIGFFFFSKTTQEVFPEYTLDTISVRMSYPGATPREVEQSILLAIEDELADICIRIFDYCGEHDIDLQKSIDIKMNCTML